jgi:hypothetical protein
MTQQPQAKYRHDYRAPDYLISDIDLTFDLDATKTVVTAVSQVTRQSATAVPLRLDGEDLTLVSLHINDEAWADYKEEGNQLVIDNLPERFTLRIVNEISPAANTALEGLYQSSATLPGIWIAPMYWRALPPKSLPIKPSIRSCSRTATAWAKASWRTVVTGYSGRIRSRNRAICSRWWRVISMSCATPTKPALAATWRWNCLLTAATLTARRGR